MTDLSDMPRRLVELETRLAFQEQALQEMSDTMARQHTEIGRLTLALKETQDRLRGISPALAEPSEESPPPHY